MKKGSIAIATIITASAIIVPKIIEWFNKENKNSDENTNDEAIGEDNNKVCISSEVFDKEKSGKNKNENAMRVNNTLISINVKLF